jgi:hypothetical protein
MATGMPWPGELNTLKRGIAKLIGLDMKEYEELAIESEGEQLSEEEQATKPAA